MVSYVNSGLFCVNLKKCFASVIIAMLGYCGVYTLDMKTSSLKTLIESNRTVAGEALNLHDPQENSCTTEDAVRELRDIIRGSGTGITALEIPNCSNLEQILASQQQVCSLEAV